MIIGIDIDDTIADTCEIMLNYAQEYTIDVLKREPILKEGSCNTHFYVQYLHNWKEGEDIDFTVKTNDKGYVNLTIPYDKGFSIYVNGVKTDYIKTNMSFIGFKVGSGSNHIEITYTAPYSNISKIMSLVGILLFSVELYYEKKCKTILK